MYKSSMVEHAYNLSTKKVVTRELEVQAQPQLYEILPPLKKLEIKL